MRGRSWNVTARLFSRLLDYLKAQYDNGGLQPLCAALLREINTADRPMGLSGATASWYNVAEIEANAETVISGTSDTRETS